MGSIYPYTNAKGDKLYRISYRRPDNKQTTERGFKRKKDAELRLAEVETSKARGDYVNPSDANVTIAELAGTFLENSKSVMKPSAFKPVDSAWRVHVSMKWGKRSVGSIRHTEVQTWVSALSSEKSATTVLRCYGLLAAILDQAVKDRRITRNVARDVSLPRKQKKTNRAYLTHQQVKLLAQESAHPEIVLTLAYTGLRWGEATAIRLRSVDPARRRFLIEENAVMVGTVIEVGTPKTHESRSVPYPAFLEPLIVQHSAGKKKDELLFGNGVLHMRLPNSAKGWFSGAVERAQQIDPDFPRVTPHDLRHTAASLAIAAGANVKAVQRMLGHASAAMTLDTYADLFEDDLDVVADALNLAYENTDVVKMLSDQ